MPLIKSYPASFVINTDPSYKEGEQWLGFYFDRNKTCYFFDSFGNSPEYFNLGKYTKTFSNSVEYNEDQIQGFFTNTCGHYVVFFILMINRGFSIRKILSCFNLKNFDFKQLKPTPNKFEEDFNETSNLFNTNMNITNSELMVEKSRFKSFQNSDYLHKRLTNTIKVRI